MADVAVAGAPAPSAGASPARSRRRTGKRRSTTYLFRFLAIGYLLLLVAWPVALVAKNTFADGTKALSDTLGNELIVDALRLTLTVAVVSVAINLLFGVGMSLLLVRYRFPGRRVLSALIDLPLSVSPVVVGLALVLVYNPRNSWFGPSVEDAGISVIFAWPGLVLATVFVSLPLMIRELVPVLEEIGIEQEQAARSLGANAWQTFWRITFPSIRWAIVYGLVLSLARSLGEFGAVKIVSGNRVGKTQTATLVVEQEYQDFHQSTAYATSFLLAFAAILCIVIVALLRPKDRK